MTTKPSRPTKGSVKLTPEGRSIVLTTRLIDTDYQKLKEISAEEDVSLSVVVRDAIKHYLYGFED